VLLVELHHLALQPLRLVLVAVLDLLQERGDRLHPDARLHGALIEWPQEQPDQDAEDDEHPAVGELQLVVHPDQDVHDQHRDGLDDGLQEPAVRIGIVQIVAEVRQPPILEGPDVHW